MNEKEEVSESVLEGEESPGWLGEQKRARHYSEWEDSLMVCWSGGGGKRERGDRREGLQDEGIPRNRGVLEEREREGGQGQVGGAQR